MCQKAAPLGQPREDLACCLGFDSCIYALGGITASNNATNSVERYNPNLGSWQTVKSMKHPRISFTVVPTPKGLFVIGGHTTKKLLKEVEFYDYEE